MNDRSIVGRAVSRMPALLFALSLLPLLAACGGGTRTCVDADEPYLAAENNPPLRIPEGLSEPNRSERLQIPDVQPAPTKRPRTSCLDEPPSYFRSAGTVARSPEEVVASWAQAWANREADAVIELYSAKFQPPTDTASARAWLEQRREQVATGPLPEPTVESLQIEPDGADRRIARFVQTFGANSLHKELILIREAGSWRILEERVIAVK